MTWTTGRWLALLDRWDELLRLNDPDNAVNPDHVRQVGAAPGDMDELESRIERRLPPSYRTFLEATNGAPADLRMRFSRTPGRPSGERVSTDRLGHLRAPHFGTDDHPVGRPGDVDGTDPVRTNRLPGGVPARTGPDERQGLIDEDQAAHARMLDAMRAPERESGSPE